MKAKDVAVIGLGVMGRPMARHLIAAGHRVAVYDLNREAVAELAAAGARPAETTAEAVAGCSVAVTVLPDGPDVEAVALGPGGIYANAGPGALHVDCSTISPATARSLAAAAAEAGLRPLDAPVSGGEKGAVAGTLSVMVGGEEPTFRDAAPLLEAFGGTVAHVGPAGAGQTVKAANQLIVAGTIELVAEAIVFLEAHGVDPEAAIPVLAGGLAGSAVLDSKAAAMLRRDFTPGFRIDLHHKDLGIVTGAARAEGVAIPLGGLAATLVGAVRARGGGGLDHGALLALVEELSGRVPGTGGPRA